MEKLLQNFIDYLNKQNQVMDSLSELGQEKKELIILGKVKELDEMIKKENTAINELQKLEEGRFKIQGELAKKWGQNIEDMSAREILSQVREEQPSYFDELNKSVSRLDFNLTRLKAINNHNNELLEDSLKYIGTIEALIHGDKAGIYSNTGAQIDDNLAATRKKLLDKKV